VHPTCHPQVRGNARSSRVTMRTERSTCRPTVHSLARGVASQIAISRLARLCGGTRIAGGLAENHAEGAARATLGHVCGAATRARVGVTTHITARAGCGTDAVDQARIAYLVRAARYHTVSLGRATRVALPDARGVPAGNGWWLRHVGRRARVRCGVHGRHAPIGDDGWLYSEDVCASCERKRDRCDTTGVSSVRRHEPFRRITKRRPSKGEPLLSWSCRSLGLRR